MPAAKPTGKKTRTAPVLRRLFSAIAGGAAALLLVACAPGGHWVRDELPLEDARDGVESEAASLAADRARCEAEAAEMLRRDMDIDTDYVANRDQNWRRTGIFDTMALLLQARNRDRRDEIVAACLERYGWVWLKTAPAKEGESG